MDNTALPKTVIFCCHNAVASPKKLIEELEHPENIKLVQFPCTSKLEVQFALKAFEEGIDGVCIFACMEGACHYLEGNLRAKRRVQHIKGILHELGLGKNRVALYNVDSAKDGFFLDSARFFINQMKEIGPNPLLVSKDGLALSSQKNVDYS
jgi:coenzyme F420-reducing hydrogenase delta subunit